MNKFERIRQRYLAGYVTDEQLTQYVSLGAMSAEQAAMIRTELLEGTALFGSQKETAGSGMNNPDQTAPKVGFWNRIKRSIRA